MVRHNNVIPNNHFRKKWQRRVRTFFWQPTKKLRRRQERAAKAEKFFPRPINKLRPVVRGQTARYNKRIRLGRGFTSEELKEAGIPIKLAPTIGIFVDKRRKNRCLESLQANVARLKAYRSNLVIFPRDKKKVKKLESAMEDCQTATQYTGTVMPLSYEKPAVEFVAPTAEMKAFDAFGKVQEEIKKAKEFGKPEKEEKEEKGKKKKK